ncbi:MAG: UTP--glucose-1-phosphate uridylyltransferase [Armatimonadota bacterium]
MKVRKAVITAAGRGTRQYPATNVVQKELFPLVDRDGIAKPVIQLVAEEALESGIEEICIVTAPDGEPAFREHFRPLGGDKQAAFSDKDWALRQSETLPRLGRIISYAHQESQEGFGHAVYCARAFVGEEPFLLMLGDHVYISNERRRCARQLLDAFERHGCTVSSVQRTPASELHLFGAVGGEPLPGEPGMFRVTELKEKPSPDYARAHLRVSGLGEDEYLCFFGMHVFTPGIFNCLREHIKGDVRERGEIQLTSAQDLLRQREQYLACEIDGLRLDMGVPEGYVQTQVALALHSSFADRVRQWVAEARAASGRACPTPSAC